jgi:aminoglycoside phosphotransferase (APT) family kinase protein
VAKPTNASGRVSGTGVRLAPELRAALGPQFVQHLAAIHRHDFRNAGLDAFEVPQAGTQCALWGVNWWDRVWEEDGGEEIPLLRVASAWLRRNLPVLERPVVVHADYRFGNFLFTEHDSRMTAVLDWELGRIGDRHQDIAWTASRALGTLDDDGKTFLVCSLMPEPEFLERYQRAADFSINPKTLHWHKVYNYFWLAVLIIGTGYRIARLGKTHQDVLVTWLIGIGYMVLDAMRELIEEAG